MWHHTTDIARVHLLGAWVLCSYLASACGRETIAPPPAAPVHFRQQPVSASIGSPTIPTDTEREFATSYASALAEPGFNKLAAMLSDDASVNLGTRSTHGRARVIRLHEEAFGALRERNVHVRRVWLTDSTHPIDSQAIEWTMTAKRAGTNAVSTDSQVTIQCLTLIWASDNGIISELHIYCGHSGLPSAQSREVFERVGSRQEQANAMLMRSALQALEDENEPRFLSTLTDDVEVLAFTGAQTLHGKNAARAYFRKFRQSLHLLDTVVYNVWGVQTYVVFEYAITGLQIAPLSHIPFEENHPLNVRLVDIAELQSGKIVRIWRYSDLASPELKAHVSDSKPLGTDVASQPHPSGAL